MTTSGKCLICEDLLSKEATRKVKEKGVRTLIEFSIKWKDDKHSQLKGLNSVIVHEKYKKNVYKKKEVLKFFNQDIKLYRSQSSTKKSKSRLRI